MCCNYKIQCFALLWSLCGRVPLYFPKRTFLVLLLGDYSHGHAGWRGEFPSTRQAADLQWTEVTLQGVLQSHVSLLALFLLLRALPRPVVHLEPHHFTARTRRTTKETQAKSGALQRNSFFRYYYFAAKTQLAQWERKNKVWFSCWQLCVCVVVPSSRKGGGHRGRLWGGAPNLLPIRTSRWGRWGRQDACVAPHRIIWVHCKFGGKTVSYTCMEIHKF